MSDKAKEKKKTPMTGGDADRIGASDTPDEGFKKRARAAADKMKIKQLNDY